MKYIVWLNGNMKAIILLWEGLNHQFALHSWYTCILNITLLFILTHTLKLYIVIKNIFCFFFFFANRCFCHYSLKLSDWRQAKSGLHNRLRSRIYGLIFIFIFLENYSVLLAAASRSQKRKKKQESTKYKWMDLVAEALLY